MRLGSYVGGKYVLALMMLAVGALCAADTGPGRHATTRQDLIGVWRLISIGVEGPVGRQDDPFYEIGRASCRERVCT